MKNTFFLTQYIVTLLLIFFNGITIQAQNQSQNCSYSLSGNVSDEHDRQPLPFATIFIAELETGVISDSLGNYRLEGLCEGLYTVTASHIGCESVTKKINLRNHTVQNFITEHHEEILETIKITGKKNQQAATMTQSNIKGAELEQIVGKSLGEALTKISGVNSLQTGPTISKPIIHGLHSNRVLMLNNGVRQEGQQWGAEHAPEIDPFIAAELSVVKGAASVQYGSDAIGGVVLIEPAPLPISHTFKGKFNLVGMSNGRQATTSAQLEGGSSKWKGFGWRLQGTLKKAGDFHTPNYSLTNTAMQESNASAALGFKKYRFGMEAFYSYFNTELGILRGSHIGNLTDLEAALEREVPLFTEDFNYDILNPKQKVAHHLAKLTTYWRGENWGKLQLQYAFQFDRRREFDIRRGNRSDIPSLDLNLQSQNLDLTFEHRNWGKLKGRMGVTSSYKRNRNNPDTGVRPLIPYYNQYGLGAFWIEQWAEEKWELEAGIRYDFQHLLVKKFSPTNELLQPTFNFHNVSTSIGGKLNFNEKLSFRSNLGTAFRPPNVNELFSEGLHHGAAAIEEGNDNLATEKSLKWVHTLQYQDSKKWQWEVSAYANWLQNFIYLTPTGQNQLTIRGAFPVFQYVQTNARLLGLDGVSQWQFHPKWAWQTKASLLWAKDVAEDDYLIFMPANRLKNSLVYSPKYWGKWKDLEVKIGHTWVAQQNRVPIGVDIAEPPDAYSLVHIEVGGKLPLKQNSLGVHLEVQNLFNTVYRDYLNRLRYFADEIGRNFAIRLTYHFTKSEKHKH